MSYRWILVKENCPGCGICADVCPEKAINMTRDMSYPQSVPGKCTGCKTCQSECPFDAIEVKVENTTGVKVN